MSGLLGLAGPTPAPAHAQDRIPDLEWQRLDDGPELAFHSLTYDPDGEVYWIFGGQVQRGNNVQVNNLLHRLDATDDEADWESVMPAGQRPEERRGHSAVYDPLRKRVIVYGGSNQNDNPVSATALWFLDLSDPAAPEWKRETVTGGPTPRFFHAATYLPGIDAMIVSGGVNQNRQPQNTHYALLLGETPMRWERLPNAGMSGRGGHFVSHDAAGQRILCASGAVSFNELDTVREVYALDLKNGLDGADRWTRVNTAGTAFERAFAGSGLDAGRGLLWMQGGASDNNNVIRDLSVLDLSDGRWTRITTLQGGPNDRGGQASAFDPDRGRLIVHGGRNANNQTLNDTRALVMSGGDAPTEPATSTATAEATTSPSPTTQLPSPSPTIPDPGDTATPTATDPPTPTATQSATAGPPFTATPTDEVPTATATEDSTDPRPIYMPFLAKRFGDVAPPSPTATQEANPEPSATDAATAMATTIPTPEGVSVDLQGHLGGEANAVAVVGDRVYLGVGPRLEVLNASNPAAPTRLGLSEALEGNILSLAVDAASSLIYVGHTFGLSVLDVSDPSSPQTLGMTLPIGDTSDLVHTADRLYAVGGTSLVVFDRSVAAAPVQMGTYRIDRLLFSLAVDEAQGRAYLGGSSRFVIVDISDPAAPKELSLTEVENSVRGIHVAGNLAFLANDRAGLRIIDVSDPATPVQRSSLDTGGRPSDLILEGDQLYVADSFLGLSLVSVADPDAPALIGNLPTTGFAASAIALSQEQAFLTDLNFGLEIIDPSTPASPVALGQYPVLGRSVGIAADGDRAYLAQSRRGVMLTDVSNAVDPTALGQAALGSPEGFFAAGDRLYTLDTVTLRIFDVSDPTQPNQLGSIALNSNLRRLLVADDRAYIAAYTNGLIIVDVSDPANPNELSRLDSPGTASDVALEGTTLYLADQEGGLRILDVADPANPTEIGALEDITRAGTLAIVNERAYVASDSEGLHAVDISDPSAPTLLNTYESAGSAYDIVVQGEVGYLATQRGMELVDLGDPNTPTALASPIPLPGRQFGVSVEGQRVMLAGDAGLVVLRVELR